MRNTSPFNFFQDNMVVPAVKNIGPSQIDFTDFTYSLSPDPTGEIDESLRDSISRYGILHPPVVREVESGLYRIVAGRNRLLVHRALAPETACTCLAVPRQVPEIEVFDLLLAEILLRRPLTIAEKAILLQKIVPLADEQKIVAEFMERLELAPDGLALKQTLQVLELEEPILLGLHQGLLTEAIARDLVLLTVRDRAALFRIITVLRPSHSNQKKILQICRDLAGRKNTSIAALLDHDEVLSILDHENANPPQKTKHLVAWLSRRHRPRAAEADEEFSRFLAALRLPRNAAVSHTPFFEDDTVTLAITFSDRGSLQQAWEKIKHAADNRKH